MGMYCDRRQYSGIKIRSSLTCLYFSTSSAERNDSEKLSTIWMKMRSTWSHFERELLLDSCTATVLCIFQLRNDFIQRETQMLFSFLENCSKKNLTKNENKLIVSYND